MCVLTFNRVTPTYLVLIKNIEIQYVLVRKEMFSYSYGGLFFI